MKRPGAWLRAVAARVSWKRTMDRLIDPIIGDLQREYSEAVCGGRSWRAAWIRVSGYAGFVKAVGLHVVQSGPRVFRDSAAADGSAIGRILIVSTIAFVAITLLMTAPPMFDFYSRHSAAWLTFLLLPQAVPLSIPIALPLGVLLGHRENGSAHLSRGIALFAIAGSTVSFVTLMWLVPEANQAWRVAIAQELGARGVDKYSLPRGMNELPFSELVERVREFDASGRLETAARYRFHVHLRFALPAATFVLSLFALGIRRAIRSRLLGIVAFVAGVCGYYTCLWFSDAARVSVPPAASLWAQNLLFLALSVVLLTSARRRAVTQA